MTAALSHYPAYVARTPPKRDPNEMPIDPLELLRDKDFADVADDEDDDELEFEFDDDDEDEADEKPRPA